MSTERDGMVLVTGANGFVGAAVSRALATRGRRVRAAVRGLAAPLPCATSAVPVGDIDRRTDWSSALAQIDVVIHLAARVHQMRDSAADPLEAFRAVNTEGTRRLAEQAASAGVRRFVFVSSVKVNGDRSAKDTPFRESDSPAPVDAYGLSKWEAEIALKEVCERSGMEWVVVRPPLVYGPGVRANFLAMMRWLKRGLPLPLGAVENRRSLVGLYNLADLISAAAAHPAAANQVFFASDDEDLSTPELLRRLAAALGVRARLLDVPPALLGLAMKGFGLRPQFDRLCGTLQLDTAKARRLLEWTPPQSVDQALASTAAHMLGAGPK